MTKQRGFTLMEVVVALAVFGVFLMVLTTMATEMRAQERRNRVSFMTHPQVMAVLARLRKDVLDAFGSDPYPPSYGTYQQTPKTLIVYSVQSSGFTQTVVWDFSTPGEARRIAYSVGGTVSDWVAHGVPELSVDSILVPNRPWGVRLTGLDANGKVVIDQILLPRAHE